MYLFIAFLMIECFFNEVDDSEEGENLEEVRR